MSPTTLLPTRGWRSPAPWVWGFVAVAAAAVFAAGALSSPKVGDELIHYDVAQRIYHDGGARPGFHELLQRTGDVRKPITVDILWHYGLAALWVLLGGPSQALAQAYNAAYLALLAWASYLLARHFYDRQVALLTALIAATIPMTAVYSVVLHCDVAVGAMAAVTMLMAVRRRYVLTGLMLGLSILMKRTGYFIVPGVFLLMLLPNPASFAVFFKRPLRYLRRVFPRALAHSLIVGALAAAVLAPDWAFRYRTFGDLKTAFPLLKRTGAYRPKPQYRRPEGERGTAFYDRSSPLSDPKCLITHPGAVLLVGLGAYLMVRRGKRKDYALLLLLIAGAVVFVASGKKTKFMLRYLFALVPLLAVMAALGIRSIRSRPIRAVLILGCLMQFGLATYTAYGQRRISRGFLDACAYLKNNTSPDAAVMTVPTVPVVFYAHRIAVWGHPDMAYMLWWADEEQMLQVARKYNLRYVLVDEDRVYDDSQVRQQSRFPKSFVTKMDSSDHFQRVFPRKGSPASDVKIWEILQPSSETDSAALPAGEPAPPE